MRTRWAAIGAAVAVSVGGGGMVWMASAASDSSFDTDTYDVVNVDREDISAYVPIEPCRLLDTRSGTIPGSPTSEKYYRGIYFGEIGSSSSQGANFTSSNNIDVYFDPATPLVGENVTNNSVTTSVFGDCVSVVENMADSRVPTAIVANLTVIDIDNPSYLTLYPANVAVASKPYISNITVYPQSGQARMNEIVIPLGPATGADVSGDFSGRQAFRIYNEYAKGSVNVIIDVVGYYYSQQIVQDVTGTDANL